jgi:hypothetical protein
MSTRKYNRKPIDVRERGGTLGVLLAIFADQIKQQGPDADPVKILHDVVHDNAHAHQHANPPPAFEERELVLGLLDGLHHFFHHKGTDPHAH